MNELPKSVRDELARQQAAGGHPDADLLNAYAEGTATPDERAQMEQHLATCGECREVLFLSVPEKPAEAPSVIATKLRNRWFPTWAPWAAAAAVLIAATFTYTRYQSPTFEAKLSRNATPASVPAAVPAEKNDEESRQKFQAPLDSTSPAQKESSPKTADTPAMSTQKNGALSSQTINEYYRRDELKKKSEDTNSFSIPNKDNSLAGSPIITAPPTVAPAPEPPTYAARAAKNSALKPGPAAPTQNQMQNQVQNQAQNQATQNVAVGAASETVEVTSANDSIPVQDAKVAGGVVGRNTVSLAMLQPAQWRISKSGVVERALSSSKWEPSLSKPGIKFTVVATVGPVVWAGGTDGALFRSLDAGNTWLPVTLPGIAGKTISKIEFRDAQTGTVTASDHHSWSTSNGGETWQQP